MGKINLFNAKKLFLICKEVLQNYFVTVAFEHWQIAPRVQLCNRRGKGFSWLEQEQGLGVRLHPVGRHLQCFTRDKTRSRSSREFLSEQWEEYVNSVAKNTPYTGVLSILLDL